MMKTIMNKPRNPMFWAVDSPSPALICIGGSNNSMPRSAIAHLRRVRYAILCSMTKALKGAVARWGGCRRPITKEELQRVILGLDQGTRSRDPGKKKSKEFDMTQVISRALPMSTDG